jgi:predicted TIM-barrel fold metal-dependent hydrolase
VRLTRRAFLAGATAMGVEGCAHHELAGPFPKAPHETPPHYIVDVHCHAFNGSDLPIAGFIEKISNLPPALVGPLLQRFQTFIDQYAPTGAQEIAKLGPGLPLPPPTPDLRQKVRDLASTAVGDLLLPATLKFAGNDLGGTIERFVEVVELVTHYRYEIAAKLATTYDAVDLFTPAMVDFDLWSDDLAKTPIAAQIVAQSRVSRLAMLGRIPGAPQARVHPLAPFNPLREARDRIASLTEYDPFGTGKTFTAETRYECAGPAPISVGDDGAVPDGAGSLALVRYAIEKAGFIGVKVYPPVGFRPLDNATLGPSTGDVGVRLDLALRAAYAYCEAEQVPVMSHTGNSNGFAPGYGELASPDSWRPVMAAYPNLRLNLAHFGALEGAETDRGVKACEAWIRQAAVLMNTYPHIYADVGCSSLPVYEDWAMLYLDALEDIVQKYPIVKKRLMFGTDFWLNRFDPNSGLFVDAFAQTFEKAFGVDARRDMMGANALRFLGLVDDAGQPASTRPARRLRDFYGATPRPPWLG